MAKCCICGQIVPLYLGILKGEYLVAHLFPEWYRRSYEAAILQCGGSGQEPVQRKFPGGYTSFLEWQEHERPLS